MEIICFCHLRWDFVYQRPQHLMTRFAGRARVHLWEEPRFESIAQPALRECLDDSGVTVLTPLLPHGLHGEASAEAQRVLLDEYLEARRISRFVAWYYTPMALEFTDHLRPAVTVYDCMDELSAFQGAPPALVEQEQRLFARAQVVFTGGASIFASKRSQHENVHLFPSSIDRAHFGRARSAQEDPGDQAGIAHPRIGFFGVLDERLDRDLLREVAAAHPEWSFVLIGPVVKIREDELPRAENLHYLGQKSYTELPQYLANWDVAMLPFARSASTRFISPTKTPEYLAGGKPVVSTPIDDVVRPYGELGLVRIGGDAASFGAALAESLKTHDAEWLARVDAYIADKSWDRTFQGMWDEIERVTATGPASSARSEEEIARGA